MCCPLLALPWRLEALVWEAERVCRLPRWGVPRLGVPLEEVAAGWLVEGALFVLRSLLSSSLGLREA